MSYENGGLSVADAIALRDDNGGNSNGFGDGNGWWIMFLFFLLAWGGGGFGGYGNGGAGMMSGALTRADLCQDMNFSQLENGVRGISQGICDSTFALNNSINGVNTNMMSGFAGVDNAICNLGFTIQQGINGVNVSNMQGNFALQQAINADTVANMQNTNALSTQLANCCCENRQGQADIKYAMAQNTCAITNQLNNSTRDIIDSQTAGTRAILDYLCQDKIATLQSENQGLRLAASQERQNNYLVNTLRPCPQPAYITCNPFTGGYGYGSQQYANGGCGC